MQLIRKAWKKKYTNQLMVTIPNGAGIKEGDYIKIKKAK